MAKHKIYVASSWRNEFFPTVVDALRSDGHEVYDFRNPPSGHGGFRWSDVDADYMEWTPRQFRDQLSDDKAKQQFANDLKAMQECDVCVLLLPCGRSAHTEAGWFSGSGKKTFVYIPVKQEPELMYSLFDGVVCSLAELLSALKE